MPPDSILPDLNAASDLDGTELVYGVQDGGDVKITASQIAALSTRSYVTPEDFGAVGYPTAAAARAASPAAQNTAFEAAMAAAVAAGKTFLMQGLQDTGSPSTGAVRWYAIEPTLLPPEGLVWEWDGDVGLAGTTTTDALVQWTTTPIMTGRGTLYLDGGNTSSTIANGLNTSHIGLLIYDDASYGTRIYNAILENIFAQNFGGMGFETYFIAEPRSLRNLGGTRLGWFGICHNSPLRGKQYGGIFTNIFPGQASGTSNPWERNCYGFCATSSSSDPVPEDWYFVDCMVDGLVTWEAFDFHNAFRCGFIRCQAFNCAQGFAVECHVAQTMADIVIEDCNVYGYGASIVKDGLTCYPTAGITVNASNPAGQTARVRIVNNTVRNIGENRPNTDGAGGISVRQAVSIVINGNQLQYVYQSGIVLAGGGASPDECVLVTANNNVIQSVVSNYSIQAGFRASSRVLGMAFNNWVDASVALKSNAYYQVGTPTYIMNYGTIGDGLTGDWAQNIAYDAT